MEDDKFVLPSTLEEMEAALDREDPERQAYLQYLKSWGITPNRNLRKKEKRQQRRRKKMMEKTGVSCECANDTPPKDLTKVASGKPILCVNCGRTWFGEGDADDADSASGSS